MYHHTRLSQAHILVSTIFISEKFSIFVISDPSDKMSPRTKIDDKLEGIENLRSWKYIKGIILEENDLARFINGFVPDPEEDEAKEKYKKYMIITKRIITNSIKDHLIPQVSSKDTPKEMFDSLS